MKKIWLKGMLAAVLLGLGSATCRAEGESIAFIDLDRVFNEYHKTKIADAQLKDQADEFKQEHQKMVDDLKALQDEFNALRDEAQNTALSEDAQNDKRMAAEEKLVEVREKEGNIRRFDDSRQKQLDEQSRRMRKHIVEEIQVVVKKYAEGQNFTAVIDSSGDSLNGVPVILYTQPKLDITDAIVDLINKDQATDEEIPTTETNTDTETKSAE